MQSIRSGIFSTEFYVTLLILGLAAAFGSPVDTPWQARLGLFFGAVASGMAYKWARTSQKGAAADLAIAQTEADSALPASAVTAAAQGEASPDNLRRVITSLGQRPPSSAGFARIDLLLAILVGVAVFFSGCAWLKTQEGTAVAIAGDVAHCAEEGALAAVGPLAQTLADAALHNGEADWAGELARLEASAGAFRDCVILAALNRIAAPSPVAAPVAPPTSALVRFKPLRAIDEQAEVAQAKIRLRTALQR